MGQITSQIEAYRAGRVTWKQLEAFVVAFPFKTPTHMDARAADLWSEAERLEGESLLQPDTWGEVEVAWARKLLTDGEFAELGGAFGSAGTAPPGRLGRIEVKGDVPGHEFHGNQWTGGHGDAPVQVHSIPQAIALLGRGRGVMFDRPERAVTLLNKLNEMAQ